MNYGWAGSIQEFLKLDKMEYLRRLHSHVYGEKIFETKEERKKRVSQIRAWEDTFYKLKYIFQQYPSLDGSLIFEYNILRGSGRRPDVILILNGYVLVIECKSYNVITPAEFIQTSLYVRDLQHYHSEIQRSNIHVMGTLLLTNDEHKELIPNSTYRIYRTSVHSFHKLLVGIMNKPAKKFTLNQFINGIYEPSPSILEAAKSVFNNEPLPTIKAVGSSNFNQVKQTIEQIIQHAKDTKTHHLVLVSGEPGAGKTYLGLHLAHNIENAVYLSGNGPLVDVLQDTLQNKTFVQGLYGYKMDYLRKGDIPHEQVIIFDEAQRAWDTKKVDQSLRKIGLPARNLSEPDIIIDIATKDKPWSVTIGLIGEGQEIYSGEEGGLQLWNTAINNKRVVVHAKHRNVFFTNAAEYHTHHHLHLDCSFRAHTALKYYEIINSLLDENFDIARNLVQRLAIDRYSLFVTRDLELAKTVALRLYQDDVKTVGVICSSGANQQKEVPVLPWNKRNETPSKVIQYFNYPESEYYCKKLNYAVTEFHTQGLELDMAIVHWDDDLYIKMRKWCGQHFQRGVENKLQIKLNSYRVILTRGRDGTIIYIPNKRILDETWHLLKDDLGIPELD